MRGLWLIGLVGACGGTPRAPGPSLNAPTDSDPKGLHHTAISGLIQPLIDAEIATGIVVGIYDAGKLEVYGFGAGPEGKPPTADTLFEIGSITKVYTSLLFADAIQRREVGLETELATLLPPGVTVPTLGPKSITLGMLALHTSGLPRLPPSIAAHPESLDPYGHYSEDALYADLVQTQLTSAPGDKVVYSNYGTGVLGFALGRKLGTGFPAALQNRILLPLALSNTYFKVPAAANARRAVGTNDDLVPTKPWTFDAMAGAGALISTVRDQLSLIDAELDAASGSKQILRPAMRLTQEPQLDDTHAANEGLGWQIDSAGRYWHNGSTGGFSAFIGFDPKTRRGIVLLASTQTSLVDHVADQLYKMLAGETATAPRFPTPDQLAPLVGTYDLGGTKLHISQKGKRLYVEGPGEPPARLVPISDHEMWLERVQAVVVFEGKGPKVERAVFMIGAQRLSASRID